MDGVGGDEIGKDMKTYKTNTNIWPLCRCCTYWGPFDYEGLWGDIESELRREGRLVCDDYDSVKLRAAIVKCANDVIGAANVLRHFDVMNIRVTGMDGPKYYNYGGDWLDLEVDVSDGFFDLAERTIFSDENRGRTEKYIREHFASRDGFISSMPDSEEEVRGAIRQLKERPDGEELYEELRWFGAVMALLWNIDGPETDEEEREGTLTGQIYTDFVENYYLSEFCTTMDIDEAKLRYPLLKRIEDRIDRAVREDELMVKTYCKVDKPDNEGGNRHAHAWLDERRKALEEWREKARGCVETWMDGGDDRINHELAELENEISEHIAAVLFEDVKSGNAT